MTENAAWRKRTDQAESALAEAREEAGRLKEALTWIASTFPDDDETPQDYRKRMQHAARRALSGGKP